MSGLEISPELMDRVATYLPPFEERMSGAHILNGSVFFNESRFVDAVSFQGWEFRGSIIGWNAVFESRATFVDCHIAGTADFRRAHFEQSAEFDRAVFGGDVHFDGIVCAGHLGLALTEANGRWLDLSESRLNGLSLIGATVKGNLIYREGSFDALPVEKERPTRASLNGLVVGGYSNFTKTQFAYETLLGVGRSTAASRSTNLGGQVWFTECRFGTELYGGRHLLENLEFEQVDLSRCGFFGTVSMAYSKFNRRLVVEDWTVRQVVALAAACAELDEGDERMPSATVNLTELSLKQGGVLQGIEVEGSVRLGLNEIAHEFDFHSSAVTESVTVLSTKFGYATFDLSSAQLTLNRCQFPEGGRVAVRSSRMSFVECVAGKPLVVAAGIDGPNSGARLVSLDGSNIDQFVLSDLDLSETMFTTASAGLDKVQFDGPPEFPRKSKAFRANRQIIRDETVALDEHRAAKRRGSDANPSLHRVAAAYRKLRKGREDSKDEPGGADFYYGEMEMRRRAASNAAEKWLLTIYWLCSGYALRAWRAIASLAFVLALGGFALHRLGYGPGVCKGWLDSTLVLAQISVGLAKSPDGLSRFGSIIVIAVRLLCPALLALAVLAMRGRIKR